MMNLWMDTAQTRWTARHKQHIGQEACFFGNRLPASFYTPTQPLSRPVWPIKQTLRQGLERVSAKKDLQPGKGEIAKRTSLSTRIKNKKYYDCAAAFTQELDETVSYEYTDDTYHTVTTKGGTYCAFCYGTNHTVSRKLERHSMVTEVLPQPANGRFATVEKCSLCDYARYDYTAAKAVIADYYGVVDGKPHTITVSDLSEAGVRTAIRYGNSADSCTMTSTPNYTEAGQYMVYYEITYTYKGVEMTENGVAKVWLRDESTKDDGSCACGCGNPNCGCQNKNCNGNCCADKGCGETHKYILLDSTKTGCTTLGYDRYLCTECGKIEKRDYVDSLGHAWQSIIIRDATCENGGKTIHRCDGCGSSFVTDYTDALGHSWDKGTLVTNATCTGEGVMEYRCTRCGYHCLDADPADGHIPGAPTTCTEPQLCTRCGAVLEKALGHDYKSEVTAPTCTEMGYTTNTCTRCGDSNKTDYTEPAGHKPGDWIIDKEPTTDSAGSKHKECENCGEKLETAEIEKIYNSGTTDSKGEVVVGGYLVTVTDTDTKNPIANAAVALHKDNSISIRLPNSRLLDYADQTTVTVQLVKDKSAVSGMSIQRLQRRKRRSPIFSACYYNSPLRGEIPESPCREVGARVLFADRTRSLLRCTPHPTGL